MHTHTLLRTHTHPACHLSLTAPPILFHIGWVLCCFTMTVRLMLGNWWGGDSMCWWGFWITAVMHYIIYSSVLICRQKAVTPSSKTQMSLQNILRATGHLNFEAGIKAALWTGAAAEPWGKYMKRLNSPGKLWLFLGRKYRSFSVRVQGLLWSLSCGLRSSDWEGKTWLIICVEVYGFLHAAVIRLFLHSFLQLVLKLCCVKTLC